MHHYAAMGNSSWIEKRLIGADINAIDFIYQNLIRVFLIKIIYY